MQSNVQNVRETVSAAAGKVAVTAAMRPEKRKKMAGKANKGQK